MFPSHDLDGHDEEEIKEISDTYKRIIEKKEEESTKLTWSQKRFMRKLFKKAKKKITEVRDHTSAISEKMDSLDEDQEKELLKMKDDMINAIIGDKEKGEVGLSEIFEISDEKGLEITRESLQKDSVDQVTDLFESLLNELELHI